MVDMNKNYFEKIASKYLLSKVLTLTEWSKSILTGLKGDILALYGLCVLMDKHCLLHLKNGRVWTTVQNLSKDHEQLLRLCRYHLVYLGRGIFMELMLRLSYPGVDLKLVIIGELTSDENILLDKVILKGLGVAVSKLERAKPSSSAGSSKDLEQVTRELALGSTSNENDKLTIIDLSEHTEHKKQPPNTDLQEQTENKLMTEPKNRSSIQIETAKTVAVNKEQSDIQEVIPTATGNAPIVVEPTVERSLSMDIVKTVPESEVINKLSTEHICRNLSICIICLPARLTNSTTVMEDMLKSLPISKYSTNVEEQLEQYTAKRAQDNEHDSNETDIYWPNYQSKSPAGYFFSTQMVNPKMKGDPWSSIEIKKWFQAITSWVKEKEDTDLNRL